MTTTADAAQLIDRNMPRWPAVAVPLGAALDRILAEDVAAERDIPAFDRVTMDGIAFAFGAYEQGTRDFAVSATLPAGVAAPPLPDAQHCIRVMTGAVLPEGADTVVPIERVTLHEDRASIAASARVTEGQFIHRRGSDREKGATLLATGARIGPPEMAVLASVGKAELRVAALPKIAVVSTGDELVGVDEPLLPHQIRSSNGRAIEAALERHRCAQVTRTRLRDEPETLLAAIATLHDGHDALILSGGVSMGDFDFVPAVLERLGARLIFHRIEQRPGQPMWFGMSREGKPIFALPGNPVSTLVCLTRYVLPAMRRALGATDARHEVVRLSESVDHGPSGLTYFVPVCLAWSDDGIARARPRAINTSGDFSSLAGTDGIVELPPDRRKAGDSVALYRW